MSAVPLSIADHLVAVVDHLNAAGLNVAQGAPPATWGWAGPPGQSEFADYGIVWRIGSKDRIRWSLEGTVEDVYLYLFIRSFGPDIDRAQRHADAVAARLSERDPQTGRYLLDVPGRRVVDVRQDNSTTSTATYDLEVPAPEAGEFFAVRTVPDDTEGAWP